MGDVRDGASALTSAALVETRVEAVAPRRNKRRHPEMALSNDAAPLLAAGIADRDGDTADTPEAQPHGAPAAAPLAADDLDDPAWREHWPQNEVRIVGRLLPRASDAPVLDGVRRTRMEVVS